MTAIRRILRDPLVYLLLIGGALFALYSQFGARDLRDADETVITVDRDALMTFMQYRLSAFEPEYFEAQFDALTPEDLQQLLDAYVREEAMVREARAMGLDLNDYVIRRRLIQKIQFLVEDSGNDRPAPTEAELRGYFERHRGEYSKAARLTFTHVFVDDEKQHAGGGRAAAERLGAELQRRGAGFNDAPAYGDRFPYQQNYVDRDETFLANQFGAAFARAVMGLPASKAWTGPIRSNFGYHLVYVESRTEPATPSFADVRDQVESDYLDDRQVEDSARAIDELLAQYTVKLTDLPEGVHAPGLGE